MSRVRLRLPLPPKTSPEELSALVAPLMGLDQETLAHDWARDGVAYTDPLLRGDADLLANVLVSFNVHATREAVAPSDLDLERLDPALVQPSASTINGMEGALLQQALAYLDRGAQGPPADPTVAFPPPLVPETVSTGPLVLDLAAMDPLEEEEPEDLRTLVDPPKGLAPPSWARPSRQPARPRPPMEHPQRPVTQAARRPPIRATQPNPHLAVAARSSAELVDRRVTLLFWLLCAASASLGLLALMR